MPAEVVDSVTVVTTPPTFVTRRLVVGEDGVPTPPATTPPPADGTATETFPDTTTRPTRGHRDVGTPETSDAALMGPGAGQSEAVAAVAPSSEG